MSRSRPVANLLGIALGFAVFPAVALFGIAGPGLGPATTAAAASLVASDPAAGAALAVAPNEIRLTFSEPVVAGRTSLDLIEASDGAALATGLGSPGTDPSVLVVSLPAILEAGRGKTNMGVRDPADPGTAVTPAPALPDGRYTVAWRAISARDGQLSEGTFTFSVGASANAVGGLEGPQDSGPVPAVVLLVVALVAIVLAVAMIARSRLAIGRRRAQTGP